MAHMSTVPAVPTTSVVNTIRSVPDKSAALVAGWTTTAEVKVNAVGNACGVDAPTARLMEHDHDPTVTPYRLSYWKVPADHLDTSSDSDRLKAVSSNSPTNTRSYSTANGHLRE